MSPASARRVRPARRALFPGARPARASPTCISKRARRSPGAARCCRPTTRPRRCSRCTRSIDRLSPQGSSSASATASTTATARPRLPAAFRADLAALTAGRDWFWVTGNHDPDRRPTCRARPCEELAVGALIFRHEPSRGRADGRDRRPSPPLRPHRAARPLGAPALLRHRRRAAHHAGLRRLYRLAQRARPRLCRPVPARRPDGLHARARRVFAIAGGLLQPG